MNSITLKKQIHLTGEWKGVIIYGERYGSNFFKKELFFTVIINELNGIFTGTAQDTGGVAANPDKAIINGVLNGSKISFSKQYKSNLFIEENELTTVEEHRPGPAVIYSGVYNFDLKRFSGDWKIIVPAHRFGKDGWERDSWNGKWSMVKN